MTATRGRHWSFDGEVLEIFETRGQKVGNQAYLGYTASTLVATPHLGIKQQIEGSLTNGFPGLIISKVGYISLDEFKALQLFFEGALLVEALERATETDGSITVQIAFSNRSFPCLIRPNPLRSVMFYGLDGALVSAEILPRPYFATRSGTT